MLISKKTLAQLTILGLLIENPVTGLQLKDQVGSAGLSVAKNQRVQVGAGQDEYTIAGDVFHLDGDIDTASSPILDSYILTNGDDANYVMS